MIPCVIDNQEHRLSDALNELLTQTAGKPVDFATAYFAISGYRLVKDGLHAVGAFRLLLGSEPQSGADIGRRANAEAPFPRAAARCMVRLVEQIIEIEENRGEIGRTDRSALDPRAQRVQDLLDRILFRMAGPTDDDAAGLEKRLEGLL